MHGLPPWSKWLICALLLIPLSAGLQVSRPEVVGAGIRWSWVAPGAQPVRDGWVLEGARLEVLKRERGLRWALHAEAGARLPLRFRVEGVTEGTAADDGTLRLSGRNVVVTEAGLTAWQPLPSGERRPLLARYERVAQRPGAVEYAIALSDVDPRLPVEVDPELTWTITSAAGTDELRDVATTSLGQYVATQHALTNDERVTRFVGGAVQASWTAPAGASIRAIAATSQAVYVTGVTTAALPREVLVGAGGDLDGFLITLDPNSLSVLQTLRVGTSSPDVLTDVAVRTVDADGNPLAPDAFAVALVGHTANTQPGALPNDNVHGPLRGTAGWLVQGRVDLSTWPTASASLLIGGSQEDRLEHVAWRDEGPVAAGITDSSDVPTTLGAVQPFLLGDSDALLVSMKDASVGGATYFGGPGRSAASGLFTSGPSQVGVLGYGSNTPTHVPWRAEETVTDGFFAVFDPGFTRLLRSTRLPLKQLTRGASPRPGFAGVLSGGPGAKFELLSPTQQHNGGEDLFLASFDVTRGLPVWTTWLGGAYDEGQGQLGADAERGTLAWGATTRSSAFANPTTQTADQDTAFGVAQDGVLTGFALKPIGPATETQCSPPIGVTLSGAPSAGNEALHVEADLSDVFADPDCRVPAAGVVLTKSIGHFFVKPRRMGTTLVSLSQGLGSPTGVTQQVEAKQLQAKVISLPAPQTVATGACLDLGPLLSATPETTVSAFFREEHDERAIFGGTKCVDPPGSDPLGFISFQAQGPGPYLLQMAGGGQPTSTGAVAVADSDQPDSVLVLPRPRRLVAGQCSAPHYVFTMGRDRPVMGSTGRVDFIGGDVSFFSDVDCKTRLTSLSWRANEAVVGPFYMQTSRVGPVQLSFDGTLGPSALVADAVQGPVAGLTVFGETSLPIGACRQLLVATTDSSGNLSADERIDGQTTLSQQGTGAVDFFSDESCRSAVSELLLPEGMWWGARWVRGTRQGDVRVVVRQTGGLEGQFDLTVNAPAVTQLELTQQPSVLTLGVCSATAFVVRPLDGSGTPTDLAQSLALASNDGTLRFYSDAACGTQITSLTAPIASSGRSFWVRSTTPSTSTTVTVGTSPLVVSGSVRVEAGAPTSLTVTSTPASAVRGQCVTLDVSLRDANGFPAQGVVAVTSIGAVPLTFGGSSCAGSSTLNLPFTGQASLPLSVRGDDIGQGEIRLAFGALQVSAQLPITAPAVASWRFVPTTLVAQAGACTAVRVEARDASGRTTLGANPPLDGNGVTFHLAGGCGDAAVTVGPAAVPETGAIVFVRATQARAYVLGVGAGAQRTTASLLVSPAAPARISAPATFAFEARTCGALGSVALFDAFNNPITTFPAGLDVAATGSARVSSATDCTGGAASLHLDGPFPRALFVSSLSQGSAQLTFTLTGTPGATTALSIGWPRAVGLVFQPAPPQPMPLVAGACGTAQLFAIDDGGVPTRWGSSVALSASTTSAQLFANGTCAVPAATALPSVDELGATVSFSETRAGDTTVNVGPLSLSLAVDAGPAARLAMSAPTFTAKTCFGAEVRWLDAWGNLTPHGATMQVDVPPRLGLSVASGSSCVAASTTAQLPGSGASRSLSLTAIRAGTDTLRVTSPGFAALDVPVTVLEGLNDPPVVTLSAQVVYVDEADAGVVDLEANDLDWDALSWSWTGTPPLQLGTPLQLEGRFAGTARFVAGRVTSETSYPYAVMVSDGRGHVVDSGVVFVVRDTINELPVAVIRTDAGTVESGQFIEVSGAGSSDPNPADVITHAWSFTGGVMSSSPSAPEQRVVAPPVGPGGEVVRVTLVVTDSRGGVSSPAELDVAVVARDVPRITSVARTLAQRDVPFSYDDDGTATATARFGTVRWSLDGPAGASIDPDTGRFTWTPTTGGVVPFVVRATTEYGWAEQRFDVTVLDTPRFVSTPNTTAALLRPWSYDADGRVEALGATWFRLDQAPVGMVIEGASGTLTWTPLVEGVVRVVVVASNSAGESTQEFDVSVGGAGLVQIADTANRRAQRGVGYVYDADRSVDVSPPGTPVRLLSVSDPSQQFIVSPSGEVSWIPSKAGTFSVQLGAGLPVATTYQFEVEVQEPSTDSPVAIGVATPEEGEAPLATVLDGTGSTAAPGRTLVLWSWEKGDGSPPRWASTSQVTYAQPGGYVARLEVADDLGSRASVPVDVSVGEGGVLPPRGRIVVSSKESVGQGRTSVSFSCECSDPGGRPLSLRWLFGDGVSAVEAAPTHVYTSSSVFRVRLEVSNGLLVTRLTEDLELRDGELRPPFVRAWGEPVVGRAPLEVKFTSAASDFDGLIVSREWSFGEGASAIADVTTRRFEQPGHYTVSFRATDDDGLSSMDFLEVTVTDAAGLSPPVFVSAPSSRIAQKGVAWRYDEDGRLAARGATRYGVGRSRDGVMRGAPEGMTVDVATGLVTWTPQASGAFPVFFWAENDAGRVWQDELVIDVPSPPAGCGCSSGGELLGLVGLLVFAARRRARS